MEEAAEEGEEKTPSAALERAGVSANDLALSLLARLNASPTTGAPVHVCPRRLTPEPRWED